MAEQNLLDIVTKVDRPIITIDGVRFEMRHPNELSMSEFHKLSLHGRTLVLASESYDVEPDSAYEKIVDGMNGVLDLITPDVPATIREKLNPFHVQQMLDSFTRLSRIGSGRGERPRQQKPSRGSSASTQAAARNTG